MDALQIKLLTEELKDLPDSYLKKILQYINILKASEKREALKPFTYEEFIARYEISEKQFEEGNVFNEEEVKYYFKKKKNESED
ncbi:MAG TPA: hypothetical protein VNB90_03500 [Cytophagaceae bacterium]|jgi:hypothetical protein|nr:hypothetical protein [Cytophagaceae bacterium]